MIAFSANTVLILVDVQHAFNDSSWGERNNPNAESNVAQLLKTWRLLALPVIHIQHLNPNPTSIFNPSQPGFQIKEEAKPIAGEPVLIKSVNSAFIGTDLEARLRSMGMPTLVIAGITTDHCVSTTTRMAGNLGFETFIVSDATATFERTGPNGRHWTADEMHDSALASLNKEFASVVSTEQVLNALDRSQVGEHGSIQEPGSIEDVCDA